MGAGKLITVRRFARGAIGGELAGVDVGRRRIVVVK